MLLHAVALSGAMPTLEWACRRKTGTPRGHESADNPSLRKNMATPRPTQDIDSILRVAMPPDTLPQRMATPPKTLLPEE